MQPRIRMGLIVGAIGLALNVCVAGFIGLCGPAVSLLGGVIAGFLAAQQEKAALKADGARLGAVAGVIAGALILAGQILGGVGALAIMQYSGIKLGIGNIPSPSASPTVQAVYYLTGLGTATCIGLVGVVLSALAGAGAGYMAVQTPSAAYPPLDLEH